MTDLEYNLMVEGMRMELRYDDCNPDVGWGMSPEQALQNVVRRVNYNIATDDVFVVLGLYQLKYGDRR
jgi:hypothetical protein